MEKTPVDNYYPYIADCGYEIINFSGKLKDSPSPIKHILRDYPQGGYFAVNLGEKTALPLRKPPTGKDLKTWIDREAFFSVLAVQLARCGWVVVSIPLEGDVTLWDARHKPAWEFDSAKWADDDPGFYACNGRKASPPMANEMDAVEWAANEEKLLDGYQFVEMAQPAQMQQEAVVPTTHPLIGKYFLSFVDGAVRWQGLVLDGNKADGLVVQLFDWQYGNDTDQRFIDVAEVKDWTFYDNGNQMLEAYRIRFSVN